MYLNNYFLLKWSGDCLLILLVFPSFFSPDRLSFQLATPNTPPTNDSQTSVQDVSNYIRGSGTRPSWVVEGVAAEIALGTVVASQWFDTSTTTSDYVSRR